VTIKRHNFTKSERECVKGIIHNLSLQRLSDGEIVQWLHDEKQTDIHTSTVSKMKTQIDRTAEKWYTQLRNSTYRYIANYKERLDSLLSYQKILHGIIATTKKDEVKIRAISELTTIEMNIFSLWKQLPDLNIVDKVKQEQEEQEERDRVPLMVDEEDLIGLEHEPSNPWHDYYQCDGCKRWWSRQDLLDYHKRKSTKYECSSSMPKVE
jgi:hypothetical protein